MKASHAKPQEEEAKTLVCGNVILFASKTCPNCAQAERILNQSGVNYTKLLAEDNADLVKKYGIRQAPTVIVENGDQIEKVVGVGPIRKFVSEFGAQVG